MKRKPAAPVFKPYVMHQPHLLPPSYDDLIEPDHLVRVVSDVIDRLDLRPLLAQYKGGGTSSYHPRMLLKVLVYAYTQKLYSSRKIAKALRENIHFMCLSGENRPGDTPCLIPHLEQVRQHTGGRLPQKIVADAAYGSEENYAYLDQQHVENYLKYNTFYQDTHHYRNPTLLRTHQFRAEHFGYDPDSDTFLCPAHKRLHFQYPSRYTSDSGYVSERRIYECFECASCPLKRQCTKAQGNRQIRISFRLLDYRRQARANLTSEEGQRLRAARSTEVETVFGHLKPNMGFRRFHLRGLEKVKTEWGLVSIAHNLRKLAA